MAELSGLRPVETGIRGLLQDPNYLAVWVAGGLMGVIRWFQLLALGIYTFEITGSPLLVSMVPVLYMLPLPLFGPLMGVIADRVNRKLLLVWATVAIFTVAVALALLAHTGELSFYHVALAAVAAGLFWTTDMPVRRRLLGDLSGSAVSAAMGLDSATNNATRMAGPLLGGVMLQLVGMTGVFALSAAVYAVCLLLIVPASLPGRGAHRVPAALLHDLLAGALFVIGERVLRRILIITIVFNMFGFPFTSMIPVIGAKRLGLDPFMVGVLSSLEGFGAFVGALMVAMWAKPEHFFRIYFWGTVIYLALVLYLGVLISVAGGPYHSFLAASATLAVIGLASACFAAMQGTLTYLWAPPEYRSRVLGVLTLCIGTGPVGFFLLGWMSETYGVPWGLVAMAGEGLAILLLLWLFSGEGPDDGDRLPPGQ
jgi:MFS family permease